MQLPFSNANARFRERTWLKVLVVFLVLGLTTFGGPVAHIGYFRREIVERRRWVSEAAFAELVGICHTLPGPSSSQTGFALGPLRAGPLGGLAAWLGFTLPSAVIMATFACAVRVLSGPFATSAIQGLRLAAVPIVAQAVLAMARTLAPDAPRASIAVVAAVTALMIGDPSVQIALIAAGAVIGALVCPEAGLPEARLDEGTTVRRAGFVCLVVFAALLGLSLAAGWSGAGGRLGLAAVFYRAGALVFGGGHVVLPLLRVDLVPRLIDDTTFLAGYGGAQAVPGPLFTFATFLGTRVAGATGGAIATCAIFLPGLLLVAGCLPIHSNLVGMHRARKAVAGANAAVVGILAAALYDPMVTTGLVSALDVMIASAAMAASLRMKLHPVALVAGIVTTRMALVHLLPGALR